MAARRSALGRGLGALIPPRETPAQSPPEAPPVQAVEADGKPLEVEVDHIEPNPEQPRRHFAPEQLGELAASIREHGVLQPVVVRRKPGAGEDRYELVVGERRWRAAQVAGRKSIPVVVADIADRDRLAVALVENVQRHDLNPIELALAFKTLSDAGATQEEIGQRVSLDRSTVANHIRLLELPRSMQEDVEHGQVSTGHAKALLSISNPERRYDLRRRIVNDGISVREAERLARTSAPAPRRKRKPVPALDADLQRVVDQLRERLKTRVRVVGGPGRGRLEIEYFGSEDLGRIADTILRGA